jgi:hypothetical protein
VSKLTQERSSRRIEEAKNIAKLDFGVSVVAIVVLGEHDRQRLEQSSQPPWGTPPELAGVAPPDVKLAQGKSRDGARPGDPCEQGGNDEIGDGAEEAVEQHGGIGREDRVVEIRALAIVMRSQVQREPKMLRDVIEERRPEVSGNERDDESGNKRNNRDDVVWLHGSLHIPHETKKCRIGASGARA